ncbi:MarR family winged helix-turn-helix transcriptional regulator [Sulfitobacter mediterraneus]|uniref:MarR family winged helix-turn-helix transcriptional regulator n=1 Tax=Sulfitobacter mediterraneus TaxID=83219 RepID=UPI0021A2F081|nr:MarR family transcriptional regulator [Sulfitobacter mediterraneus]UWR13395.1 MarR family transcriptional regulator [Sulfitobacter mediterraneus]
MQNDQSQIVESDVPTQELGLESLLNYRVQRLASKMTLMTTREVLKGSGVNIAEWRVIARLMQEGPQNMTAISRMLGLDGGRASRLMKAVETKGWVKREADPEDGRVSIFHLTEKAVEVFSDLWPKAERSAQEFHTLYSPQELATLYDLLDRAIETANRKLVK